MTITHWVIALFTQTCRPPSCKKCHITEKNTLKEKVRNNLDILLNHWIGPEPLNSIACRDWQCTEWTSTKQPPGQLMMEVHKTQCPDNYFPESEVVLLIYPVLALQYLSIGQYWHEQNSVERYLGDVYALLISKLKYLIEIDIRPRVFILLTISKFEFIFHLVIKAQTIVAILRTGSGWVFLYFGVHKFRCSS